MNNNRYRDGFANNHLQQNIKLWQVTLYDKVNSKMINYTPVMENDSKPNLGNTNNSFYPETIDIINCALNAPLILVSIIGNALVLAAVLRTPSLRSPSTMFLCSLAVSDLLTGLVVQPVYIAANLKPGSLSSLHATRTLPFLVCGVSLCTMAAISVDRFLALHYHMRYPNLMTTKRAIYAIAVIWLIDINVSCFNFWSTKVSVFTVAVGIAICFLISTYFYIRIYLIVRHHQLQIHAQQQAVQVFDAQNNLGMVQSKKSAVNTFIYYICMILCYSPVLTYIITVSISPKFWVKTWKLTATVAFMNSSINPLLYCWRNLELRAAVFKTLRDIMFKQN